MKQRIVKIEWLDSKAAPHEWEYRDDLGSLAPVSCITVGFILEQTKDYVTVAHTISENQILGRLTIPRISIKNRPLAGKT